MSMLKKVFIRCFTLVVFLTSVVGCVAYQGFTVTARAGDTVTFAVGTLDNIKKADVQLAYYSDSNPGVPIDITTGIRSIVRLYPDQTSSSYWEKTAGDNGLETIDALVNFSGHGPWQTVVVVDLPITLPAGTGHVKFTMGAKVDYPAALAMVDDVNVGLTILANEDGTAMIGEAHEFGFRKYAFNNASSIGDLNKLEPLQQVVVRFLPSSSANPDPVSAANYQIKFTVLDQSGNDVTASLNADEFAVVLENTPKSVSSQVNLLWKKTNSVFDVSVISASQPINPRMIRFSIILSNIENAALNGWTIGTGSQSLQSVTYYDSLGDVMAGPNPQVKRMYN